MQAETTDETFHDFTPATPWERYRQQGFLHASTAYASVGIEAALMTDAFENTLACLLHSRAC